MCTANNLITYDYNPLAECFLDYSHTEDGPARFCFHSEHGLPAHNTPRFYFKRGRMAIFSAIAFAWDGFYKNPSIPLH